MSVKQKAEDDLLDDINEDDRSQAMRELRERNEVDDEKDRLSHA